MKMRTAGALGLAVVGVASVLSVGAAAADPAPPYVDLQAFGYVSCGGPLPDRAEPNSLIDHGWVTNNGPGTAHDVTVWFNGGVSKSAGMLAPGKSLQIEQVVPSWGCPFRAIPVTASTSTYDLNHGNNSWMARN